MKIGALVLLLLLWSCKQGADTIKIKGSDTEVNLTVSLAEAFHFYHDSLLVSVSGGGSGLGIASLYNGNADIANSSRRIKKSENFLFEKRGIEIDSFVFAQDAIAFVVSSQLPVDSVDLDQLSGIMSGDVADWSGVCMLKMPINIYGRQNNSGTYEFVRSTLHIKFSPYAKQMNGSAQILEAIKADGSGIGYVGAGYLKNEKNNGLKVLKIFKKGHKAISPFDSLQIASGAYLFQRPLFQYYRKTEIAKIKPLLDFERSKIGTEIIKRSGYYPTFK